MIAAVTAVPAAPVLLPAASPAQPDAFADDVARLRVAVGEALDELPAVDAIVLLVPGSAPRVLHATRASLLSYGVRTADVGVAVDAELLDAVVAATGAEAVCARRLDGDPAVLAMLLAARRGPECALVPVEVPTSGKPEELAALAASLARVTDPRSVAVLATGDLAATLETSSPGYLVAGAEGWNATATAAVVALDVDALAVLGPQEAERVQARGWAPLLVLTHLAADAGLRFTKVSAYAVGGVGQLIAR